MENSIAMSDPQPSIRLPRTRRWDDEYSGLAGLVFAMSLPFVIGGVARGDWRTLFLLVLPLVVVFLGRCLQSFLAEHYVIMYSDRLEFPRYRGEPEKVAWASVQAVRWPKPRKVDAPIVLIVPAGSDWPIGRVIIHLKNISPADRLTLIRYLRMATSALEQTGWPQFCHKRVMPLIESLRRVEETDTFGNEQSPNGTVFASIIRLIERRPFVGCALSPLLLVLLVSRKTWWTGATIIGISGVVNIRLVWGAWIEPFSTMCIGTVVAMFCAGVVSRNNHQPREDADTLSSPGVITCLSVAVIGLPLLGNAMALGWVQIPGPLVKFILFLFFTIPLLPALLHGYRKRQQEVRQAADLEDAALRRWDEYVKTGCLPDARLHELVGVEPNEGRKGGEDG